MSRDLESTDGLGAVSKGRQEEHHRKGRERDPSVQGLGQGAEVKVTH